MRKRSIRPLVYQRAALYPKQEAAIFSPHRYAVIEATPKSGKTVGCMAWLLEQAVQGRRGDHYWWVAPVSGQADIAFRRFQDMLPAGHFQAKRSPSTLRLPNGAMIWFKSADNPDLLYGEDVRAAVIDEAPRCKEEAWHAVRTTVTATRGRIRIIGNVKGRRNWAYRLARQAEAGAPGMHYAKLTALDAIVGGIFDRQELADAEQMLPVPVFRELYFAEASDDEGNPFGVAKVRGNIQPLSAGKPVAWGWDLAKSVDWTVGIGLDEAGDVCRFERFQDSWESTIERIREVTGSTPALVDSTGVGDPVLERLQRVGGANFEGFRFSAPAKQQLMEGLALAIHGDRVHYPDGMIVLELEGFEYAYTRTGVQYTAADGLHDDCVMALALAVQHFTQRANRPPWGLLFADEPAETTTKVKETMVERRARSWGSWFPGD